MRILVTGARGFVGRNLLLALSACPEHTVYAYDVDSEPAALAEYAAACDAVVHLAGVNRPVDPADFMRGNADFTRVLTDTLRAAGRAVPIIASSSIQAALDNEYGRSKRAGEDVLRDYAAGTGADAMIYRLPNLFGKFCRPRYNSVVATFCHLAARGEPLTVNDPAAPLRLVYIDDLVAEILRALAGNPTRDEDGFCRVPVEHATTVGRLAEIISAFPAMRESITLPRLDDPLEKKLYSTWLSHLPEDGFAYDLTTHADARGSFTEFLRTPERGQVSVNISRPGVVKGNHYHHTKNEKFLVVAGEGIIRFRKVDETRVITYRVSGEHLQVVDIPVGYTHNIENTGTVDMVTIMWANEPFDPENPDTYYVPV